MRALFILSIWLGLAACKNDAARDEITVPANGTEPLIIGLIARQSFWIVHYPGQDGIRGKIHWRLVSNANPAGLDHTDPAAKDDRITTRELRLPVNTPIRFVIRSHDVIHNAWFPHFRLAAPAVPGMDTKITFTAEMTTSDMRAQTGKPGFDYMLFCNKICGRGHYDMQMKVVVEPASNFHDWCRQPE